MARSRNVRPKVRAILAGRRGTLSALRAFIRQPMPFVRNEHGFRYELDEDNNSTTYMQPKRVPR